MWALLKKIVIIILRKKKSCEHKKDVKDKC